jgi:hypothetical protein
MESMKHWGWSSVKRNEILRTIGLSLIAMWVQGSMKDLEMWQYYHRLEYLEDKVRTQRILLILASAVGLVGWYL